MAGARIKIQLCPYQRSYGIFQKRIAVSYRDVPDRIKRNPRRLVQEITDGQRDLTVYFLSLIISIELQGQPGNVFPDIVVQAELSLLFQQQNPQSGERFAHGTEFKQCRRIRSSFLFPIRIPIIPEHRFFRGYHHKGHPRSSRFSHRFFD